MTTFELDLSKSDSFIDGIQEIFKPPSVESSTNVRVTKSYMKSLHTNTNNEGYSKESMTTDDIDNKTLSKSGSISWKKPKANAHEYCDSCGTFEGERLVCDRCPASFHLECLDPPIEIDEAPVGVWYCNRCTAIMKDEEDKSSSASGYSHNKGDIDAANAIVSNGCNINNYNTKRSARSTSSGSSEITTEMLTEDVPLKKRKLSESENIKHLVALQNIQDVVQCINPKEFELPKYLIPGIKLPFTYKTQVEMKTKSVISLENGIIPRPLVTCFECTRSCFYGSLIQCDYCPLYFHLDCLDPPLIQLPSRVERWMCPNHIEQVIDNSGIIKTIRLSERINAYEEIQQRISNIDEVDLLINFGLGRGFRFGSKMEEIIKEKPKIEVPDAVKRHYKQALMIKTQNQGISRFNDQQKTILQTVLRSSRPDIDIDNTDPVSLLNAATDLIFRLVESQKIDVLHTVPKPPIVTSRAGAEQVRSRALLIPVSSNPNAENLPPQTPIRMIYRTLKIGSNADNHCIITGCKYVSPRHATISYTDNYDSFELLNYSRYGTVVDDLLISNDISRKDSHQVGGQQSQNIKDIKAFIDVNSVQPVTNKTALTNFMRCQRDSDKPINGCSCTDFGYGNKGLNDCNDRGWEDPISIRFGSVIRIGCQTFVFADMSAASAVCEPTVASMSSSSSHGSSHSKSPPVDNADVRLQSPMAVTAVSVEERENE